MIKEHKYYTAVVFMIIFLILMHVIRYNIPHSTLLRHVIMIAFMVYSIAEHYRLSK